MPCDAPQLLLVSLTPAGAAVLEVRGAGVNELALRLGHPHWMDAKYMCQLVEGLLSYGCACGLRTEFAAMAASRRARCLPCLHSHTPRPFPSCPLLLLRGGFRGSVREEERAA
jgi:hypothetical protein